MDIVPINVQDGDFKRTKKFILTELGDPVVGVLLTEEFLNNAIEEALTYFYHNMSESWQYMVMDYWQFQTEPDQPLYELPDCVDPAKIRSVVYNPQNYSLFNIAFNQNFDFLFFTTAEQTPDLTTFYFALMKQELVNKVLGQQGTWEVIGGNKIQLMPTPQGEINAAVCFTKLPDENTLEKIGWIRRYALAHAKETYGRLISRYSTIPGGMGEITMDGQQQRDEGKTEKEKLIEELKNQRAYYISTDFE